MLRIGVNIVVKTIVVYLKIAEEHRYPMIRLCVSAVYTRSYPFVHYYAVTQSCILYIIRSIVSVLQISHGNNVIMLHVPSGIQIDPKSYSSTGLVSEKCY